MNDNEAFEVAHKHVAEWEGGFSDDAADRGGVTNFGVSIAFLRDLGVNGGGDIDGDGDIDRQDVLHVTKDIAKQIFKSTFWVDGLPPLMAIVFYDFAVNAGKKQSAKFLQRALLVDDDGIIGPKTKQAAQDASGRQYNVAVNMLNQREQFYKNIVNRRPNQKVFLKGWLNRNNSMRNLIDKLKDKV